MMFLGEHQHTLDAKGRVSLPAKFRSQMAGPVVVSEGFDQCLYVYPVAEFEKLVEKLLSREDFDPKVRRVRRHFTSTAVEVELDSAGRITLSSDLRDHAHLTKEVLVSGNGNRIEIWDAATRDAYDEGSESIESLAEELSDLGML